MKDTRWQRPVSLVLISGLSYKITFNKELWTSIFPLYSMKPNLRNLFMKKLTRDRVVPIISPSLSCLGGSKAHRASVCVIHRRAFLELECNIESSDSRLNCEERPSRPAAHRRRRREQVPVRRRIHGEHTRFSRSPFCRRE